jgi:uncharacterized protein YndB with AHSA1/START domain
MGYGGSMSEKLHHATINLEHSYAATVERVFSEFADPATRAKWSAPSNDTLVYDKADFREGGRDVFRCGPPNDLRFRGVTTYQVIVPNQCVISTEMLVEGGNRLAVALNTLDFKATGDSTRLKVTIQIVSFVGPGMIGSYESGNRGALEGLSRHLAANF